MSGKCGFACSESRDSVKTWLLSQLPYNAAAKQTLGERLNNTLLQAKPISLDDIGERAVRASRVLGKVRASLLAPDNAKHAPSFTTAQVAGLCKMEPRQIDYRARKGTLPPGILNASGTRREFPLPDVRKWTRELRPEYMRPQGAEAITVATANFKGGVTKTTTAMTLAQGLSIRGHKVLAIDCDPQGSLTTLFGILSDAEVEPDQTILPLCLGEQDSLEYAIRKTYWDGIDLVPATSAMFSAEFALPARQRNEISKGFQFWNVLHYGIEKARQEYDVIVIDTPPALSYVTVNAMMAADGLVMPLPPNSLDFASSVQFWGLFHDLGKELTTRGRSKEFAFIDVLLTKVDPNLVASEVVRGWISAAYGDSVLPIVIPKTATADSASAEFGSIYDMRPGSAHKSTIKRAVDAYEQLVDTLENQIVGAWMRQVEPAKEVA